MPEPKRPLKVFLCHAHADRDPVRGLYARLTQDGVDAWLDKAKLLPGQDWELEIRKAVREADVVVVCLSKQFNQAGFRQKEVRLALDTAMEKPEGEIFIIPARLEECDNLESLRKWHWVDLFEDDGYEMLMRAFRARAEKIGVTLQVTRSRRSKPTLIKRNSSESTSLGGVNVGDGVSKSVIVAGKGNVINLNQSSLEEAVSEQDRQELRVFYDLASHYEHDLDNTNAEVAAKYLFESLTRIAFWVPIPDREDENVTFDYRTESLEYFDPKEGRTLQYALLVHGVKLTLLGKGKSKAVKSAKKIPEMLIITITQGVNNKSRIRFDSNNIPRDIFNTFVEMTMRDLVGSDYYLPKPL